jgi:hypothetical protein
MNISHINVGIIHSLIGKNDGVSIVIDQTVNAMVQDLGIALGNIFFLAAHSSPRFNAETNDIFWHKNEIHKHIVKHFCDEPSDDLDALIHEKAVEAKKIIASWVKKHNIDLLIAHNTSHPYNFITAVGLGYYIEELRDQGIIWPKVMAWWHDSYFERPQFSHPNKVIQKYLKYLPGTEIDGLAFINSTQPEIAKKLFLTLNYFRAGKFFEERAVVVPNTSSIDWDWKNQNWKSDKMVSPPIDNYNESFLNDIGLLGEIQKRNFTLNDTVLLLQHTRVVPRKKIETAIDFAFELEKKYAKNNIRKCIALIVSGHSGDEQVNYKNFLVEYYNQKIKETRNTNVILIFGENCVLSHRDIIVDKKYYNFYEIPSVIASYGGIGTYFSEIEGFGNNLLEMISFGMPVIINKYDVYKYDIEELGFMLPAIEDGILSETAVEEGYRLLNDFSYRNKVVQHNLLILHSKLDHKIIADKLRPLIIKMFTRVINMN